MLQAVLSHCVNMLEINVILKKPPLFGIRNYSNLTRAADKLTRFIENLLTFCANPDSKRTKVT